jgi:hypothetical protein
MESGICNPEQREFPVLVKIPLFQIPGSKFQNLASTFAHYQYLPQHENPFIHSFSLLFTALPESNVLLY